MFKRSYQLSPIADNQISKWKCLCSFCIVYFVCLYFLCMHYFTCYVCIFYGAISITIVIAYIYNLLKTDQTLLYGFVLSYYIKKLLRLHNLVTLLKFFKMMFTMGVRCQICIFILFHVMSKTC